MKSEQNIEALVQGMLAGDVRSLSRLMTVVEREPDLVGEVMSRIWPHRRPARRVGLSGPPGAGKSTLLSNLVRHARAEGKKVGVLCIDPTSPLTGGAILGDRIRINDMFDPADVFIRSVASGDSLGGLAGATRLHCLLLEAAGCDLILIETVGLGQVGYDITDVAETLVLVLVPESGDTIQILKSGIIELADIVVVNKADRDGADEIAETLRLTFMEPRKGWHIPVLLAAAREDLGTGEITAALEDHFVYLKQRGAVESFRSPEHEFAHAVHIHIKSFLKGSLLETHPAFRGAFEQIRGGNLDPYSAAAAAVKRLLDSESTP